MAKKFVHDLDLDPQNAVVAEIVVLNTYSTSRAIAALQQKTCAVILINAPTAKRNQWPQNVSACMSVHVTIKLPSLITNVYAARLYRFLLCTL